MCVWKETRNQERYRNQTYLVRLMHLISMWYSEAVILVKDYSLDVNFFLSILANFLRKRFR